MTPANGRVLGKRRYAYSNTQCEILPHCPQIAQGKCFGEASERLPFYFQRHVAYYGRAMDIPSILSWARSRMERADDSPLELGYRLHHGERVGAIAASLAERVCPGAAPSELYRIAGVVHDVGKAGYRGPVPHGPRGAQILRAEAAQWFEPEELDFVCLMVENHYARPLSRWYEGKEKPVWPAPVLVIQDADLLDHFGTNYFWITFHHAIAKGEGPDRFFASYTEPGTRRGLGWVQDSRRSLNFEESRRELDRRQSLAEAFYKEMAMDLEGKLP